MPQGSQPAQATVLIAAYNEEDHVAEVVRVGLKAGFAVLVVEDGSGDLTAEMARAAGAEVLSLPVNGGKGHALAEGIKLVETPFVVLLDADLVGLKPEHIHQMLEPVKAGRLDMAIGVFKSGGLLTDFGNRATPYLSGQRACKTEWLRSVPNLSERWPEPPITDHLKHTRARWEYIDLPNVRQVMKESKRGFWAGFTHRLRMYREILGYWNRQRGKGG
jgi:glycosyltransferase involved in cell wall biosynthesis